jgi:hypothetical protein
MGGTKGPRVYTLRADLGPERSYTSMAIIAPKFTRTNLLEVLLATSDCSLLVLYEAEPKNVCEDQELSSSISSPIVKMTVAPNGSLLACYCISGVLSVVSSSFVKKVPNLRVRRCTTFICALSFNFLWRLFIFIFRLL